MTDRIRADSAAAVPQPVDNTPLDEAKGTRAKDVVGRGFVDVNSVSHEGRSPIDGAAMERKVELPSPTVTSADVTPQMLQEVDDSLKGVNPYEEDDRKLEQWLANPDMNNFPKLEKLGTLKLDGNMKEITEWLASKSNEKDLSAALKEWAPDDEGMLKRQQQFAARLGIDQDKWAAALEKTSPDVAAKFRQLSGDPDKVDLSAMKQLSPEDLARFQSVKPEKVQMLSDQLADVMAHVEAIESAPREVMDRIRSSANKALSAILTGDVEDAAQWLMEVQTQLQDTRIKFDSESIRANQLKHKQIHNDRMSKLSKQLDELREAKKMDALMKGLGILALVVTYIIAVVTLITPGGQAAGALLLASAVVMTASMVIQETGVIKDKDTALAVSITLTVLAAVLSLGAGFATSAGAGATTVGSQVARTAATATAKAATKAAAKAALKEAAKGATDDVIKAAARTAAKKVAQKVAQETAESAVTSTMKPMAKEIVVRSAKRAAEETAKKAAQNVIKESTKAATKSAVKGATKSRMQQMVNQVTKNAQKGLGNKALKKIGDTSAREATREVKMGSMYKVANRARYTGQAIQAGATVSAGVVEGRATVLRKDAADYGVDAKEDMARMARIQFLMDTMMENIRVIYEQMTSGQEIASDTMKSALETKSSLIKRI